MGDTQSYWENIVRANWLVRLSQVANAKGCKIPVRSSWDLDKLQLYLEGYEDKDIVDYLRYGWPVGCVDSGMQVMPVNHKGAHLHAVEVSDYLQKQATKNTLIGPLKENPFGHRARFSPINTRCKEDGTQRIIVDLSSPRGNSVNDGTPKKFYLDKEQELHFPTVDALVEIIQQKGPGCKLFKIDRKSAYKYEYIDPGDVHLMGMLFEGKFYFDTTLVMGARHAAGCCHRTTSALIYIHREQGFSSTCFIDDMAGGDVPECANRAFQALRDLLRELNIEEAVDKACPPATIMVFLGILFNTLLMVMEITPQRMKEIKAELIRWLRKDLATKRQVQSLIGKLNFCASVVRSGRLFFSRILTFMKTMTERGFHKISPEVQLDIKWWIRFMECFNGVSCIPEQLWVAPDFIFSTDACLVGAGGWAPAQGGQDVHECFAVPFPHSLLQKKEISINELEAVALLLGVRVWGGRCKGKKMLVSCDNQATVSIVNTGRAQNSFAQACMRELHYWCAKFDCQIRAIKVDTKQNTLADLLSRNHQEQNRREFQILTKYIIVKEKEIPEAYFDFENDW